jgi:hypothetical protein
MLKNSWRPLVVVEKWSETRVIALAERNVIANASGVR